MNHTPGPWHAEIADPEKPGWRTYDVFRGSVSVGEGKSYETLAYIRAYGDEEADVRMAIDARLMAAAPALLAIVQTVAQWPTPTPSIREVEALYHRANALIRVIEKGE